MRKQLVPYVTFREMLEAKFSAMRRLRHADPQLRYVRNITASLPEDDKLFIRKLFLHFRLNLGYDFARSVNGEVCSEMHSSRDSGRLPNIQQYMALGANPQDQAPEPTLRACNSVPLPRQDALRRGLDTMDVSWLPFSSQVGDFGLRRNL